MCFMHRSVAWVVLAAVVASQAAGGESKDSQKHEFEILDLIVDEAIFEELEGRFGFDDEAAVAARELFERYFEVIVALDIEAERRHDEAGWARVEEIGRDVRAGRIDWPWEELRELHQSYQWPRIEARREADRLLRDLIRGFFEIAGEDAGAEWDEIYRLLRHLNRARRHPGRTTLTEFWREFSNEWPEALADEAVAGRIDEVLRDAAHRRDEYLRYRLERARTPVGPGEAGGIARGSKAYEERLKVYGPMRRNTWRMAREIEVALRETDPAAAAAWFVAVGERNWPLLFEERWPDRMLDWLASRDDATEEQMETARSLYEDYLLRYRHLQAQAIRAEVRAWRTHLTPRGDSPDQLPYQRRLVQMRDLIGATIGQFRMILNPEQTQDLDYALGPAAIYLPGFLFGPDIHPGALKRITGEDPPSGGVLVYPAEPLDATEQEEGGDQK